MKDGSPQVTPLWIDIDGDTIVFNTAEGRTKPRNLDRDGRIAISVHDQGVPYRYVQVRGVVESKSREGADAHIDKMSKKYTGNATYAGRPQPRPNSESSTASASSTCRRWADSESSSGLTYRRPLGVAILWLRRSRGGHP